MCKIDSSNNKNTKKTNIGLLSANIKGTTCEGAGRLTILGSQYKNTNIAVTVNLIELFRILLLVKFF